MLAVVSARRWLRERRADLGRQVLTCAVAMLDGMDSGREPAEMSRRLLETRRWSQRVVEAVTVGTAGSVEGPGSDEVTESDIRHWCEVMQDAKQNIQDVPVAVSAFTDERRDLIGITTIQDLTNFTPGLSYNSGLDRASLRGIGRHSFKTSQGRGTGLGAIGHAVLPCGDADVRDRGDARRWPAACGRVRRRYLPSRRTRSGRGGAPTQ